ncbi:hypothetical protein A7J50_1847 [Pseudomonas antarctica]|jgi:hypothetical protein|uniref:Chromosome segregation ATPase n=1 Tax=Pseudomonas antarctica TaxID=219572 RepID=A0A172YYX1_9PSED|nr:MULTISPECIES: hypothetical protein [Pseudomonas]ANF85268.1 hypothetical protein A7J50_1847 [Pseudomonas antarctica]UXV21507.1 hypothetical protein N4P55_09170 [Pseudomonas fluorescens]
MMLLRTLVLERSGQDAPVNGALLCGFAVAQTDSNFLVYSLDEEIEPGNSRVYIAALRKKLDRYFLGGVESKEDLQVAMQVFKQILMMAAASGTKTGAVLESSIPFHFIDLKGCKLPPARPEDHHSMMIKKALVMKVITLGMSAPTLPVIESASLIVPSIRFSSQMVSPPRTTTPPKAAEQPVSEPVVPQPLDSPVATTQAPEPAEPSAPAARLEPREPAPHKLPAKMEHASMVEVDSTLTSLAKVAQELAQQKLAVIEREEILEQWQARLEQEQSALDKKGVELEQHATQLQNQTLEVGRKAEKLALALSQVSGMRERLQGVLLELDHALDGQG